MKDFLASSVSGWLAIGLICVGGGLAVYLALALESSPLRDYWTRYVRYLDQYVRFLLLKQTAAEIARNQAIDGLYQFASERVLFAPVLNALQFVVVDGIEFESLRLERRVETKVERASKDDQKPREERTEHVKLLLLFRNYGENAGYDAWERAIREQPYFSEHLRRGGKAPVVPSDVGPRQTDPAAPAKPYQLYQVECVFEPRPL